jgi:transposase-like protein
LKISGSCLNLIVFHTTNKRKEKDMTHEIESTTMDRILQPLIDNGFDGIGDVVQALLNSMMLIEREKALGAGAYERSDSRDGYANGFKPRSLKTRVGKLELSVPQVRGSSAPFYPSVLERGQRNERALLLSLTEMYVQGVSTRKVSKIVERMCGFEVSSEQVSRACAEMDTALDKWRKRPIGCVKALIFDAFYENVRVDGAVVSCAVLVAIGILENGCRSVLGVSVSLSEAEVHWRQFIQGLKERGMHGVEFIVSDDHSGLKAALRSTLSGVAWQRCQFHLQQNAQSYVTKKDMKSDVAADIRDIFNAPSLKEAQRLLNLTVEKYAKTQSNLSAWMEENLPEGFTVFKLPPKARKRLRTSNAAENLHRQIRRRTKVAGLFPNENSLLRLVSAILSEISDEWETGKVYLNVKDI